ncbi:MAG: type II toxin-antitoxin system Phd/YefM family antitoxin [Chloroflexi bacterium]|nr:type II toxin-antitoxin system Phd/YefM family antitoxin [Chloroflexota bacterium]
MDTRITATDLARTLSEILSRVAYQQETFTIERNGVPVATLAPVSTAARPVTMKELAVRLGDLQLPGEGFADDLEAVQAAQLPLPPSPWPN